MSSPRRKPTLTSLVAFFLFLPLVYVLSYAPVFRCAGEIDGGLYYPPRESWQELYVPVEWLTDNTPIREPLLFWATLWGKGVEEDFRFRSDLRMRGADPYPGSSSGAGGGRPADFGGGGGFF